MIGILHGVLVHLRSIIVRITSLIAERIPNTLVITLTSLVIAIFIGVGIGVLSAIKQYSILDYIFMILALVGVSMQISAGPDACQPVFSTAWMAAALAWAL